MGKPNIDNISLENICDELRNKNIIINIISFYYSFVPRVWLRNCSGDEAGASDSKNTAKRNERERAEACLLSSGAEEFKAKDALFGKYSYFGNASLDWPRSSECTSVVTAGRREAPPS